MKELELKNTYGVEISVKQKKQVEHELIGKIIPHDGHKIWKINNDTNEVEEAKFSNATYHFGEEIKKEIIIQQGFTYVSALNIKNALKKFRKGENGSRPIDKNPLKL